MAVYKASSVFARGLFLYSRQRLYQLELLNFFDVVQKWGVIVIDVKYSTKITIVWTVDDMDVMLEENGLRAVPEFTEQEKAHVLHEVYVHHDANNGVTWGNLLYWTRELYGERLQRACAQKS